MNSIKVIEDIKIHWITYLILTVYVVVAILFAPYFGTYGSPVVAIP